MENIEFGKRLEKLMLSKNISNQYITEQAGISKNNVGNYKKGQIPNATILYKLSQIFGVSMEYLLTGKNPEELTQDEKELIEHYRSMNETGRRMLLNDAREIAPGLPAGVSASKAGKTGTDN